MAITFKSVAHVFATAYSKLVAAIPKIEKTEGVVEAVTAKVPVYGTLALPVEKLAYAGLGELAAVLHAGGAAVSAKLADAGLDIAVIQAIEALVADSPQLVALVSSLV